MKLAMAILIATLSLGVCPVSAQQGATNTATSLLPLWPLTDPDWRFVSSTKSQKALSTLSITNQLSQNDILSISDPVSGSHGLTRYIDAMCGYGARLRRDYVGSGSVVSVSFLWDQLPKVTRFSFYGTNSAAARIWHTEMLAALRDRLGAQSVNIEVQPGGTASRSQPIRSETNRTSSAAGSRR